VVARDGAAPVRRWVVAAGDWVVVVGGSDDDVVESIAGLVSLSIRDAVGVAVLRASNRPAAS
jgi:hypothetical protein